MQSISIRKHHLFNTLFKMVTPGGTLAFTAGRFYLTGLSSKVSRFTVPSPGTTNFISEG